jgi:hypothetical protein
MANTIADEDPTALLPADYTVPPSYVVQALEDRYIRAPILIAALEKLWPGKWEIVVRFPFFLPLFCFVQICSTQFIHAQ